MIFSGQLTNFKGPALKSQDSFELVLLWAAKANLGLTPNSVRYTSLQRDMIQAWEKGDISSAREFFYKLLPLSQTMFIETNPIPVKTSLALMGMIDGEMRLPLFPMSSSNRKKLEKVLKDYGLI